MVNGALSISSLTLSDTGMYQCIAENRHGRVFANAELRVIGKESLSLFIYDMKFVLFWCDSAVSGTWVLFSS